MLHCHILLSVNILYAFTHLNIKHYVSVRFGTHQRFTVIILDQTTCSYVSALIVNKMFHCLDYIRTELI